MREIISGFDVFTLIKIDLGNLDLLFETSMPRCQSLVDGFDGGLQCYNPVFFQRHTGLVHLE